MSDLSRQNGARWEAYIRAECRSLAENELAYVSKNWEAPKLKNSHIKWEPSKPDFSGFLPDGRHVVFEAKATLSKTSFPLPQISGHQWGVLNSAHRAGALSFVYVLDGNGDKWVFPWALVVACKAERESIPFSLDTYKKLRGQTWLGAWHRLEWEGLI